MRIAEYINGQVTYRDMTEEEIANLPQEEMQQEETLDDLLQQLNELRAKIESKVSAK